MKPLELKSKTKGELISMSEAKKTDLVKLKFKHARGQLEKNADLRKLRKEIARIETFKREKQLAG